MSGNAKVLTELSLNDAMERRASGLLIGHNENQVTMCRMVDGEILWREVWMKREAKSIGVEILEIAGKL